MSQQPLALADVQEMPTASALGTGSTTSWRIRSRATMARSEDRSAAAVEASERPIKFPVTTHGATSGRSSDRAG